MLHLLRAEPTLLPAAPAGPVGLGSAIEHRRKDEIHACLRCGKRAHCAFIAHTDLGNRWLDLCWACADWLRRSIDA
jgi:hypothetical protein